MSQPTPTPRRVVFQYLVPVHVEVEDGLVIRVTVIDETPVRDPTVVEGEPAYLGDALRLIDDGQAWPSWRFGYQSDHHPIPSEPGPAPGSCRFRSPS